jgi:serine/threonine-protein kinase
MEYVKGGNLEDLLKKAKKMTPLRVARIIGQLCEVLQAAHDESIIHRDLKPANLMVTEPDTPKERIKVMDFGLAKMLDGPARQVTDTTVDFAVGTPAYICPEQVRGEPMDHRGDLYSVGVMAFELLSGRTPFLGSSGMDVLLAHATEEVPTFAELGLDGWVPAGVEAVIRRCLSKNPDDRQQSAKELADEFGAAIKEAKAAARGKAAMRPDSELLTDGSVLLLEAFVPPAAGDDEPPILLTPSQAIRAQPRQVKSPSPVPPMPTPAPRRDVLPPAAPATPQPRESARDLGRPAPVRESARDLGREPVRVAPESSHMQTGLPFAMEAWMPETIALMKLSGYVRDCGGEVLKNSDGVVVLRLKGMRANTSGTWFGFGRRTTGPVEVELRMTRPDPKRESHLHIHVLYRPQNLAMLGDRDWRDLCEKMFIELRAYLMGGVAV